MDGSARTNVGYVVRAGESYKGRQGPNYTPGISAETVGARALWLGSVTLPPRGGRTKAHVHASHESAFYFVSGDEVELYTGDQLEHREVAHPGDYLYIPAGVPHVAINCRRHTGTTEQHTPPPATSLMPGSGVSSRCLPGTATSD